jgi:hypothetical protein
MDLPARKGYFSSDQGKFKIINIQTGVDIADVNVQT